MKNKKAISLIVLVITIIVMIIIAGAVILTLENDDIVDKAKDAVSTSNEAQVKELASVGWAQAFGQGYRLQEDLERETLAYLKASGISETELAKYDIIVTEKGVTVSEKIQVDMETPTTGVAWQKNGFTIVREDQILEIGDNIAYDETLGGTKTVTTNVDWKILGVDSNGNLLIMSTKNIGKLYMGGSSSTAGGKYDWITGAAQLDELCEQYGYGTGATSNARSITLEDVDLLTGYDKTTYASYGREVTYSYNGTTQPNYIAVSSAGSTQSGKTNTTYSNGFHYYNGETFVVANDLETKTSGTITSEKTSAYYYAASDLTAISSTENAKVYSMLFDDDTAEYWLATNCIFADFNDISYKMQYIYSGKISGEILFWSKGLFGGNEHGVRAVVTISKDMTLTGSSDSGWNIQQ